MAKLDTEILFFHSAARETIAITFSNQAGLSSDESETVGSLCELLKMFGNWFWEKSS